MKKLNKIGLGLLVLSGVSTFSVISKSQAEVIPANDSRIDDRDSTRAALSVSERSRISGDTTPSSIETSQVAPSAAIGVAPAPAPVAQPEVTSVSRSELLRRERVREEIRNEDVLQERLEALRLRDEQGRTDTILPKPSSTPAASSVSVASTAQPVQGTQTVTVAAPVTDSSKSSVEVSGSSQAKVEAPGNTSHDRFHFQIQPRGGIHAMFGSSAYQVNPQFAAGLGVGLGIGDHFMFEAGYTYSQMGVVANISNPYINMYRQWAYSYGAGLNGDSVTLKQNVIDLGVKVYVLNRDYRIRPFIGAGGAYSKSFVNYDQRILALMAQQTQLSSLERDYDVNQFLGHISVGLDVHITKNISINLTGRYYNVFAATESGSVPFWGWADIDKQMVGATLARTNFFSVMGGVGFTF